MAARGKRTDAARQADAERAEAVARFVERQATAREWVQASEIQYLLRQAGKDLAPALGRVRRGLEGQRVLLVIDKDWSGATATNLADPANAADSAYATPAQIADWEAMHGVAMIRPLEDGEDGDRSGPAPFLLTSCWITRERAIAWLREAGAPIPKVWEAEPTRARSLLRDTSAAGGRRRGPRPGKAGKVRAAMLAVARDELAAMKEVEMEARFNASRDTCRRVRADVLSDEVN